MISTWWSALYSSKSFRAGVHKIKQTKK